MNALLFTFMLSLSGFVSNPRVANNPDEVTAHVYESEEMRRACLVEDLMAREFAINMAEIRRKVSIAAAL